MKKAVILEITGRVQNVGFRFHTHKTATQLNIAGFVKNQPDGSVYVMAQGEEANLEQFIQRCHQGPTWARVDNITIETTPLRDLSGFSVR